MKYWIPNRSHIPPLLSISTIIQTKIILKLHKLKKTNRNKPEKNCFRKDIYILINPKNVIILFNYFRIKNLMGKKLFAAKLAHQTNSIINCSLIWNSILESHPIKLFCISITIRKKSHFSNFLLINRDRKNLSV